MRAKKRTEHHDLAELALAQHGVVAARQLRSLGYSENLISAESRRGRLRRLHRGVYAVGHEDLTWKGRCMGAVLANAPAAASHWSAAWIWGLLWNEPTTFHLTAPSRRHGKRLFAVHFARLEPEDVADIDAIPVTSPARTHLDLAAASPEWIGHRLQRSEEHKHFDLRKFEALLARSAHHPGYTPLSKALRTYRPDPTFSRSKLEQRFRGMVLAASLPPPSQTVNVGPYELDFYWEPERFCVELDTYGTHGTRRSFEEDRKRQRELRHRYGVEVERVTDVQLKREPDEVLGAVRAALAARRSR